MSLDSFLQEQKSEGKVDSEGQFTLDLSRAADKLAAFALPSEAHYLLKMVQVAHHLRADEIRVTVERFRTVVRFRAPSGGSITDSESIFRAFSDPLNIQDKILKDLIPALLGTISEHNLETLWSYSQGHTGRRVTIDRKRQFSIQDFTLSRPLEAEEYPYAFTLSVLHPRTWKFWQTARRRANAVKVLESSCRFSGVNVWLDGRMLELAPSSQLNDHLIKRTYLGEGSYANRHEPASNILFALSDPEELRFGLARPSFSAYVVREDNLTLWATGTRPNNSLVPDGLSSAAWALQFLQEEQTVSIRFAPKRTRCRAVVTLNLENPGAHLPLLFKVVRNGILVLEDSVSEEDTAFQDFRGCVLVFADDSLETDLTGLQPIRGSRLDERILEHKELVTSAKNYFERARRLLTM